MNNFAEIDSQSNLKYSLPKFKTITTCEVEFQNIIACKGRSISFQIEKRTLYFRLVSIVEQNNDFAEIWIKLLVNKNYLWIGLSKYSFGVLLGNCFLLESLNDCPAEIHGALIEATLSSLLNMIEASTSNKVEIDVVALQNPDTNSTRKVFFALNNNAKSEANCYFEFDEPLRPFISKILENLSGFKFHDWDLLQTSIHFQIGSTQLNMEELKDLNCNDLIFVDDCPLLHDQFLTVCIAPNLECQGTYKGNKLVIKTTLLEKMKEENNNVVDINELKVNLAFDVGEKIIQFQELKMIQPGYIFELDNLMERPVTIRANGHAIGSGELLQADEKIAVRILELHQKANG